MKTLILTITVSLLMASPVMATDQYDSVNRHKEDSSQQMEESVSSQEESKSPRHDHREAKGLPGSAKKESAQPNGATGNKKDKLHDHQKVRK